MADTFDRDLASALQSARSGKGEKEDVVLGKLDECEVEGAKPC